jgi:hypothetical protein
VRSVSECCELCGNCIIDAHTSVWGTFNTHSSVSSSRTVLTGTLSCISTVSNVGFNIVRQRNKSSNYLEDNRECGLQNENIIQHTSGAGSAMWWGCFTRCVSRAGRNGTLPPVRRVSVFREFSTIKCTGDRVVPYMQRKGVAFPRLGSARLTENPNPNYPPKFKVCKM